MPNANRRQIVLVKIEGTHRTDASPDGTDAVLVRALTPNPAEGATLNERRLIDGSFGRNLHAWGGSLHGIQLEVELKGSGAAGTPPEWAPLLRACGFAEDITPSTSVAYTPASGDSDTPHDSVTIHYNQDGILRRLIGCRGTMTLNAVAREIPVMTFNMIGHQGAADSDTALPTPTLDATVPVPFRAASLTLDSLAVAAGTFTLDLQNEIPQRPNINGADGFADLDILDRNIVGTLNPELRAIATKDWLAKWRAGDTMALALGPVGSVAGNRWALSAGRVQVAGLSFENSDGVIRNPLELAFAKNLGDDDVTLLLS